MKYETRINPYTGLECSLPVGSTEEQWEKQYRAQEVMVQQLALLEDDD